MNIFAATTFTAFLAANLTINTPAPPTNPYLSPVTTSTPKTTSQTPVPTLPRSAFETPLSSTKISQAISAFRQYTNVKSPEISVPTIVSTPFNYNFSHNYLAVFDYTNSVFEPHYFKSQTYSRKEPLTISSNCSSGNSISMLDKNSQTYSEWTLPTSPPENKLARAQIDLTSKNQESFQSSVLSLHFDKNIIRPEEIQIQTDINTPNTKTLVARRPLSENVVRFPLTSSKWWRITLWHSQPLRINEINLIEQNPSKNTLNELRWLAQPDHSYRIYFNADRNPGIFTKESGNLASAQDVTTVQLESPVSNPNYVVSDRDGDGVPDTNDNCPSTPNQDQADINKNNIGDACDDFDKDGIINTQDNCPNNPNRNQKDTDGDGIGDACDQEENRLTEKHPWVPWAGMGFAGIVLITLFILTLGPLRQQKNLKKSAETPPTPPLNNTTPEHPVYPNTNSSDAKTENSATKNKK